jgi:hypothetical protein
LCRIIDGGLNYIYKKNKTNQGNQMTKEQIKTKLSEEREELARLRSIGLHDSQKARIIEQWVQHWWTELDKLA